MALTTPDLEALRRYARLPEGRQLVLILETKLAQSDAKLRVLTGELLYQQQGRSQALAELLNDITSAETKLNRQAPSKTPFTRV